MTYVRRYIDVTFSGGTAGTVTFNARGKYALRTSARILHAGGFNYGELNLEIRGLSLAHINALSTYGKRFLPYPGLAVKVDAGDEINGMSTVFYGSVTQAWGDMKAMPDVPFHVLASMNLGQPGLTATAEPIKPTSMPGSVDVAQLCQTITGQCGLQFENNGVQSKLMNPYFWGAPWKQLKEITQAARINSVIDNGIFAIWPRGQARATGGGLVISPQTGLRDYPAFTELGVQVRYEFHRAITYGSTMVIEGSEIANANGTWNIVRIDYDLQSNTPHGQWFAIIDGSQLGAGATAAP